MQITCMFFSSSPITSPTRKAVSPEIPVSISSNMRVGNEVCLAMMDFMASIKRESSPPEATLATGAGG
ncbi:hypothetical protein D3C87_1952290 [compost metagenome]